MSDPQPNQIPDYPKMGIMTHLFRKKLTYTDMDEGLGLTQNATAYFNALPEYTRKFYNPRYGYTVVVYTPTAFGNGSVKQISKSSRYFCLARRGWCDGQNAIANISGFSVGDEIDCWCVNNNKPDVLDMSLLFQKVVQEPNVQQQGEEIQG